MNKHIEIKSLNDISPAEALKEIIYNSVRNTYNMAQFMKPEGYQDLIIKCNLLSTTLSSLFCACAYGNQYEINLCKENIKNILKQSYELADTLLSLRDESKLKEGTLQ